MTPKNRLGLLPHLTFSSTLPALAVAGVVFLGGCKQTSSKQEVTSSGSQAKQDGSETPSSAAETPADASEQRAAEKAEGSEQAGSSDEGSPELKTSKVRIKTSKGEIELELYPDKAPKSVKNFLSYVQDSFYKGTIFHRVIPDFMIQGGGFTPDMQKKRTRDPIENEADNGLKNERGTLALARTMDPHSATSQFFINVKNNGFLDHKGKNPRHWGYAVFGKVTKGMDVVDAIAGVQTGAKGPFSKDAPQKDIVIEAVEAIAESDGKSAPKKAVPAESDGKGKAASKKATPK